MIHAYGMKSESPEPPRIVRIIATHGKAIGVTCVLHLEESLLFLFQLSYFQSHCNYVHANFEGSAMFLFHI